MRKEWRVWTVSGEGGEGVDCEWGTMSRLVAKDCVT